MRILITGGGGLIGQEIARKHLSEGDKVYIYDTRVNPYNTYENLVGEDITFLGLENFLVRNRVDVISHQAAFVGVGQSQYEIEKYVKNNVGFTAELLDILVRRKIKNVRLTLAGSMGPYGDRPENVCAYEEQTLRPESIYAVTKMTQEELFRVFCDTYDVTGVSLRYFSVYSTTQSPLNPYTGIMSVIANMLLNKEELEIYDNGQQTRDMINVKDIAKAHFLATRAKLDSTFTAINVGTGHPVAVEYIAEVMSERISPNKNIRFNMQHRLGDIMHMRADTSRAESLLGFYPDHNIHDDVLEYCDFINENKHLFLNRNTVEEEQKNIERRGLVRGP